MPPSSTAPVAVSLCGGGIAPSILEALATGAFRATFERKDPLVSYLAAVPIYAIKTGADAGLRGAAVALPQEIRGVDLQAKLKGAGRALK